MPILKNYTAQLSGTPIDSGRRATAADFGGEVGAALQGLGREASTIATRLLQQKETDDARQMLTGIAQLNAQYTQAQQEAIATGADLDKLREKFQGDLDGLREKAVTGHGAQTFDYHTATTLQSYDLRTGSIKAQKAAATARVQVDGFAAAVGQQVFNDPSSLADQQGRIKALVANLPPGVSPEARAAFEQELWHRANYDAARGAILIDPAGAQKALLGGRWTVNKEQYPQLVSMAESQIEAKEAHRMTQARAVAWERGQKSEQRFDLYLQDIYNKKMNEEKVPSDSDLLPDAKRLLMDYNKTYWDSIENKGHRSDPVVRARYMARIFAPDDDPNKLRNTKELIADVVARRLSVDDGRWMAGEIANQRDANNKTTGSMFYEMQTRVTQGYANDFRYRNAPGGSILAARIQDQWTMDAYRVMLQYRKDSKSMLPLFDPTSPEYLMSAPRLKRAELAVEGVTQVNTPEEYEAFKRANKPGTRYMDSQGREANTPTFVEQIPGPAPLPSGGGRTVGGTIKR